MARKATAAQKSIRKSGRRRFAIGLNLFTGVALAALLLAMVNYLGYRHYDRADWSRSKFYTLSEKTKGLLDTLTNRIDVIVFFQANQSVQRDIENLLKEYEAYSEHIRVTQIDPDRDLARTEELARKYDVSDPNVVVFDNHGNNMYVTENDIVEYDYSPMDRGQLPTKVSFRGERAFSSAILNITQQDPPLVYFLQGHGEGRPDSFDQRKGYSAMAKQIERDNISYRKLVLGTRQQVPEDCDALIIAGPTKRFSQPEIDIIRQYLEKSGRVLINLDPLVSVGLEPLLEEWEIALKHDVVVDSSRTLTGMELFITGADYGEHPITKKLRGVTSIFYLPRSVVPQEIAAEGAATLADRPHVTSLAMSSDRGWAESDVEEHPMQFDAGRDTPGPVSIAVAAEKGPVVGIDVDIKPTRLVVFGDSDFVSNGGLTGGNADFFLSALNWLLDREQLMAIAPKRVEQHRLVMTKDELDTLFWVVVTGLPGSIALLGGIVWIRRRK